MSAHGPDKASYQEAILRKLNPQRVTDTMAIMFESRNVIRPTEWALTTPIAQNTYDACWTGFEKATISR
jgi:homogentisate 1,2-dioxygenase